MPVQVETKQSMGGTFRLRKWRVEPALNRLSLDDSTIQLELTLMDVLVCLAERAGEVLTRQEIVDRVWATEFISDNTLTHAVSELRDALGDEARNPSFIETIHRRGYRLIAEVIRVEEGSSPIRAGPPPLMLQTSEGDYPLVQGLNVIGRSVDSDICINCRKVSRHHAKIIVEGATATIEDLDSKNGTFVNGSRLDSPARLISGDEIWIGHGVASMWFSIGGEPTQPETSQ